MKRRKGKRGRDRKFEINWGGWVEGVFLFVCWYYYFFISFYGLGFVFFLIFWCRDFGLFYVFIFVGREFGNYV